MHYGEGVCRPCRQHGTDCLRKLSGLVLALFSLNLRAQIDGFSTANEKLIRHFVRRKNQLMKQALLLFPFFPRFPFPVS